MFYRDAEAWIPTARPIRLQKQVRALIETLVILTHRES